MANRALFGNQGEAEASPLFSSANASSTDGVTKIVGGKSYCINPAQIKARQYPTVLSKISSVLLRVVTAPLVAAGLFGYSTMMIFGTQSMRKRLKSTMLTIAMGRIAKLLNHERDILLKDVSGNVLDVGSGSGEYFRYLSNATRLVSIEPLENLHPILKRKALESGLDAAKVNITTDVVEDYIKKYPEESETFDWIILGNVLCEVQCLKSTLHPINNLLKPGGRIFFCEHIAKPKGTLTRWLQDAINPWWVRMFMGCNCNRESLDAIHSVPDWEVVAWEIPFHSMAIFGTWVIGLVQKKGSLAV